MVDLRPHTCPALWSIPLAARVVPQASHIAPLLHSSKHQCSCRVHTVDLQVVTSTEIGLAPLLKLNSKSLGTLASRIRSQVRLLSVLRPPPRHDWYNLNRPLK